MPYRLTFTSLRPHFDFITHHGNVVRRLTGGVTLTLSHISGSSHHAVSLRLRGGCMYVLYEPGHAITISGHQDEEMLAGTSL